MGMRKVWAALALLGLAAGAQAGECSLGDWGQGFRPLTDGGYMQSVGGGTTCPTANESAQSGWSLREIQLGHVVRPQKSGAESRQAEGFVVALGRRANLGERLTGHWDSGGRCDQGSWDGNWGHGGSQQGHQSGSDPTPVPLPGGAWLLASVLAGGAVFARRRVIQLASTPLTL